MNTTITSTAIVDSLYRPLLDVRKERRRIYMRDYMRQYRAKKKASQILNIEANTAVEENVWAEQQAGNGLPDHTNEA